MVWARCLAAIAVLFAPGAAAEDSCPAGSGARCKAASGLPAGATTTNRTGKVHVGATADLLKQEVDELKDFMHLCKERIELLEEMRGMVKKGMNLSLPVSHMRMLQEQLPFMSEVTAPVDRAPTGSADDYLISKAVIPLEDPVNLVAFMPLRSPRTSSKSSTTQAPLPSALLVAAQPDGGMKLFGTSGDLALSFSTGHEHPLTKLAVSQSQDEYLVATADAGGVIRVHKVNVRQRRLSKDEKHARRNSTDEKVSQYLGSQANVTAQFTKQMQVPPDSDGTMPQLTAFAMASQGGTKYFVTGDEAGMISIFTRNGTFSSKLAATSVPGARVEAIYANLNNLIYRAGFEWGFVNLEKQQVQRMDCQNFEGRVTSIVVDSQQSSRLLVSDEEGTVWVFNVKEKKNCKVEHRFQRGIARVPVEMFSVRGFTIALERAERGGDEASVMALNMSRVGKLQEASPNDPSAVVWSKGRQAVRQWAVHKRHQMGDLLAFLSEDGHEIEVMELLMQVYQAPSTDSFGNFKLPVIAVAIVLVLGYQYMKQKGKFGGGGGGGKFGGKFDKADFSALRNKRRGGLAGLKGLRR